MPRPGEYLRQVLIQLNRCAKGVKAALLNIQKQTQGGCQIEETKRYGTNERTENKTPEKELSKMKIANLSDAEFKTPGNKDAQRNH